MTSKHWVLLISSAILYALPFIFSTHLWWLTFLFPVPLFYVVLHAQLSFKHGYIWGIFAFVLHLIGALHTIIRMADGPYIYRFIPPIFIVLYGALSSGTFFFISSKTIKWFNIKQQIYQTLVWTTGLFVFIHYIDRYCLWIFDRCEGYFFMHPLLPIASKPQMLRLLPIIGKSALTGLLFFVPVTITLLIIKKTRLRLIIVILAIIPWITALLIPVQHIEKPQWLDYIATLPILFPSSTNLTDMMNLAGTQFKKILIQQPQTKLIIMPESSFYCNVLSSNPKLCSLWDKNHLGHSVNIVVGAFRKENGKFFNTLHWIANGKINAYFDKRHPMLLTERIPSWFNFSTIRNLYFKKCPETAISYNLRPKLPILKKVSFVPYICSELFFNEYPDDNYSDSPIITISNDIWFDTPYYPPYIQHLMCLIAQFKAIQWQRDILYISFSRSAYFDNLGNEKLLNQPIR